MPGHPGQKRMDPLDPLDPGQMTPSWWQSLKYAKTNFHLRRVPVNLCLAFRFDTILSYMWWIGQVCANMEVLPAFERARKEQLNANGVVSVWIVQNDLWLIIAGFLVGFQQQYLHAEKGGSTIGTWSTAACLRPPLLLSWWNFRIWRTNKPTNV